MHPSTPAGDDASPTPDRTGRHTVWSLTLAGVVLWWLAFPPLGWAPLAWVAAVPWLALTRIPRLEGWRPYLTIWLVSSFGWLALLEGVRNPHPILYLGWLALSLYLGAYLPIFIALVRAGGTGWNWWWRAPLAWSGLEWVRSWLVGCSVGQLAHTQFEWPQFIQTAAWGGAYLTAALMIVAAAFQLRAWTAQRWAARAGWAALSVAFVILLFAFGEARLRVWQARDARAPKLPVLAVQVARDVFYEYDPQKLEDILLSLRETTIEGLRRHPETELVVWPEASLAALGSQLEVKDWELVEPPEGMTLDEFRFRVQRRQRGFDTDLRTLAETLRVASNGEPYLIAGVDTRVLGTQDAGRYPRIHNSAVLIEPNGRAAVSYHKQHRVLFGEFIPVLDWMPWLYRFTPMPAGLTSGDGPRAMAVGDHAVSPCICFENTVPQLIRGDLHRVQRETPVAALVNISNDGWFGRSAVLEIHFACAVFRAVENRRPWIASANLGITAIVSASGEILARAPRRQDAYVHHPAPLHRVASPYGLWGDWPLIVGFLALLATTARSAWRPKFFASNSEQPN